MSSAVVVSRNRFAAEIGKTPWISWEDSNKRHRREEASHVDGGILVKSLINAVTVDLDFKFPVMRLTGI
jgi:hypothetical protein